ncbi:hypothetical protein E5S69_30560 [Cupriavidus necator]|uniref:Uncharacterized protein n=1 Tax=Cupriavidus oxalaticus TaxID=96344 RepID=A0A5P3VR67_9BURK|nr:hypothetical protein [Cupriavidus necator]QEZ48647.1 hypothetical protein D2917_30590 [Cupriavidus oxalaticus]
MHAIHVIVPQPRTRHGAATSWFPEIVTALAALPPCCILDGEVCVLHCFHVVGAKNASERSHQERGEAYADQNCNPYFNRCFHRNPSVREVKGRPSG